MVRISGLYVLSEAVMVALIGALRGAGDTFFTMEASVAANWLFVIVLWISFRVFNRSVVTAWFLLVLVILIFFILLIIRFRSGKWETIKVLEKQQNQ